LNSKPGFCLEDIWWKTIIINHRRWVRHLKKTAAAAESMHKGLLIVLVHVLMIMGCSGASETADDLGVTDGRLKPCPKTPNCVNSQAADARHAIDPIGFPGSVEQASERLLQILHADKRAAVVRVEHDYIRASFTSALFRFVDDVEFYVVEEQENSVTIHVRSASRVGYYDLGANRKRIDKIRSDLQPSLKRP
jgi:uncharacterized protein (DUF1499 family)